MHKIFMLLVLEIIITGCQTRNTKSSEINERVDDKIRIERQKILQQYWIDATTNKNINRTSIINSEFINYPPGMYNNIIFGPRYTNNSFLNEPER
jgi:hypothetical protein